MLHDPLFWLGVVSGSVTWQIVRRPLLRRLGLLKQVR